MSFKVSLWTLRYQRKKELLKTFAHTVLLIYSFFVQYQEGWSYFFAALPAQLNVGGQDINSDY